MRLRARVSEPADPPPSDKTDYSATEALSGFGDVTFRASFDGGRIDATTRVEVVFPYFGWLFRPFLARDLRTRLRDHVDAATAGTEPRPFRRRWWSLPEGTTPHQIGVIATLCAVLVVTGYCGGLFTQTVDAVADAFNADDARLGVSLALTRVGTLVALVGAAIADRRGRRRVILWGLAGLIITTALTALAPNLETFTALQVLTRGFVNLVSIVTFIAVVEEAPERGRALALSLSLAAGGLGFGFGAFLLPIADLGTQAFRILFALAAVILVMLPGIARRLPETSRYKELAARGADRGRAGEIVDATYRARFVVLGLVSLLLNFAAAPTSQFFNRYLMNERAFSAFEIFLLRLTAQSVIPFVGILIGGRLAESRGRVRTAQVALAIAVVFDVVFFMSSMTAVLWVSLLLTTTAGATGGPSISSFGNELFPTEVRGTANGVLVILAVIGGVAGLLTAGFLAEPLGGIGVSVALTDIAPFIVAIFLVPLLPEARGRNLDDVSPTEV